MLTGILMNSLLPEHVGELEVEALVSTIYERLLDDPAITDALEACNLQPTSRAAWLAANSAVIVLIVHEIGQEVAEDSKHICDAEGCEEIAQPDDIWCKKHRAEEDLRP